MAAHVQCNMPVLETIGLILKLYFQDGNKLAGFTSLIEPDPAESLPRKLRNLDFQSCAFNQQPGRQALMNLLFTDFFSFEKRIAF